MDLCGKMINIFIITGEKKSGKTTYLKTLLDNSFAGIITECVSRAERKYYFKLINSNRHLLCCYYDNGMKFNEYNFDLVNDYLTEINTQNIIIDEIGWLELEENGLYRALKLILQENKVKNLYLSMRYDIYKKLIKKFKIVNYELTDLSEIK